jgi:mannose-6-phosphate isomerase-like protein (cupin superfamily)
MSKSFIKIVSLNKTKRIITQPQSKRLRSGLVILKPKSSVGQHSTGEKEEILIIIKGLALISAGKQTQRIRQDYAIFIPSNTLHNVTNVGKTPLRYVYIVA